MSGKQPAMQFQVYTGPGLLDLICLDTQQQERRQLYVRSEQIFMVGHMSLQTLLNAEPHLSREALVQDDENELLSVLHLLSGQIIYAFHDPKQIAQALGCEIVKPDDREG